MTVESCACSACARPPLVVATTPPVGADTVQAGEERVEAHGSSLIVLASHPRGAGPASAAEERALVPQREV